MDLKRISIYVGLFSLSHVAFATAQSTSIKIMMEELRPFTYSENGKVTGVVVDLVSELMRKSKQKADFQIVPWQRAFASAKNESDTCVLAAQSEERREEFQWIGPIIVDRGVLLSLSSSSIELKSIEEAKPYRIGGYQGDARSNLLAEEHFNVDLTSNDELNAKKLLAGRIDFWVTSEGKARLLMAQANSSPFKIALIWQSQPIYLACNSMVSKESVKRMQSIWNDIISDGTLARVKKPYGL